MDIVDAFSIPILLCQESWPQKEILHAAKKLGIIVKVIGEEMAYKVRKTLMHYDILLTTCRTEFSLHCLATIQAIRFSPVYFMAHQGAN